MEREASPVDDRIARYASGRRIGPGPFAALGIPLLAATYAVPFLAWVSLDDPAARVGAAVGSAAALLAVRGVLTSARVRDTGKPSWNAFWACVPLADLVLTFQLLDRAPAPDAWQKRARAWATQIGPFEALGVGAGLFGRALPVVLLAAVFAAALQGGGGELFRDAMVARAGEDGAGLVQGLELLLGALGLYTGLQLPKAKRASRLSWLPSLFLLPVLALIGALVLAPSAGQGAGAALVMLIEIAWMLGVGSIAGGLAAAVWIVAGVRLHRGEGAAPGDVLAEASGHFGDVLVAWGTRNQIVQIGLQVIVPGVWYAISFAFSDLVVVAHPERPMLAGSTELTRGIRSKIFTLLAVGFLAQLAVTMGVSVAVLGPQLAFAALFDPSLVPLPAVLVGDFLGWCLTAWTTLALLVLFFERDALLAAKRAREASASGPAAAAP